jgi:hypothetical protein
MVGLANIDKVVFEIKKAILNNEKIRKLLYNVNPSALADEAPSISNVEDHIFVNPTVYFTDESSISFNNFIVIYMPTIIFEEETTNINLVLDIFVNQKIWLLDNNQMRLHQILSEMTKTLHDKKFGPVGRLQFEDATYTVVGEKFTGFQITVRIIEEPIVNAF